MDALLGEAAPEELVAPTPLYLRGPLPELPALAGGADARSRADVVNLLPAATPPPDLGLPDLPWRCGFPRDPGRTDVTRR